ncbi:Uncharacterised protein [Mycobacteroides abscessus subsp. abscessus]|nr:Uncharacterised protein [Mycobacteroides abscessus subsp. abscessus]
MNDSSRLRAMTGMYTLSSKAPDRPPTVMAASLPMTCAATCVTASGSTGLTLPGMIELPGCRSGSWISPRPVSGPEPIQRMSLAILVSDAAMVFSAPEPSTSPSRAACASNESEAVLSSDRPVDCFSTSTTFAPKPSGAFRLVPTAVPPIGSSPRRGSVALTRSMPASI